MNPRRLAAHPTTPPSWHSKETHLPPYRRMARELQLMAVVVMRDWTQDDTTNEEDQALAKIALALQAAARILRRTFDPEPVRPVRVRGRNNGARPGAKRRKARPPRAR